MKNNNEAWEVMKERAVFIMKGTVKDLTRVDIGMFNDGSDYIFCILRLDDPIELTK